MASSFVGKTVLVTGAGGFVGWKLCRELLKQNVAVLGFDLGFTKEQQQFQASSKGFSLVAGDISNEETIMDVVKKCDIVLHLASYGMSGASQLQRGLIERINVNGTQYIIDACKRYKVKSLVYVSTYNVVFCGQEIINGDENLPYVNESDFVDHYSRTKCIAERMVLQAAAENVLHTVAIRPAAIYGEGELRHFPRIIKMINDGLGFFAIGSQTILCDWVHADNLVHMILLAAKALDGSSTGFKDHVLGKAFHCSDDHPVNNFTFIREALGCDDLFWLRVSTRMMYGFAAITEGVHAVVGRLFPFEPLITKTEVCKVGYTHYMSMSGAEKYLGYRPLVSHEEGLARLRAHFAPTVLPRSSRQKNLLLKILVAIVVIILLLFAFP